MIPQAYINAWRSQAPWPDDSQIEQDLILSRMMVEIAADELLGSELCFRGGTCLHKLRLPRPARYSEDLDYVRRTESGIGPYLDALTTIAEGMGLSRAGTETSGPVINAKYDAEPTSGAGSIRVKVEINIAETNSFAERVEVPFAVSSRWWSGAATLSSFTVEELLGTKLRALYQRSKGRDLFDLWCTLTQLQIAEVRVVEAYEHYIGADAFTFPQLARNLEGKLADREFRSDLEQLIQAPSQGYDIDSAADLVMLRLGSRLRNAPSPAELEQRGWKLET